MSKYKVGDKFLADIHMCEIVEILDGNYKYKTNTKRYYNKKGLDECVKLPELSEKQKQIIDELKSCEDLNGMSDKMYEVDLDEIFGDMPNKDFFLALAFGYSVKKEKKYKIVDKRLGEFKGILTFSKTREVWLYSARDNEGSDFKNKFTEQELRDAGFGHEFETMAVEVEE